MDFFMPYSEGFEELKDQGVFLGSSKNYAYNLVNL